MNRKSVISVLLIFTVFLLTGCNTNHPTGSATSTVIGAGAGAGGVALFGGSKPLMVGAGIAGGAIGYYVSTLRFDSGGIMLNGGKVYRVGDMVGIYIPGDQLFEPNTDEFTSQAPAILDSAAAVLQRYPDNNIIISGDTSGFYKSKWEQHLSEKRAQKVSSYLWNAGINQFKYRNNEMRKLTYVGYGDMFPISSTLTNRGIRENNRVQITSYPSYTDKCQDRKHMAMRNVGGADVDDGGCAERKCDASMKDC